MPKSTPPKSNRNATITARRIKMGKLADQFMNDLLSIFSGEDNVAMDYLSPGLRYDITEAMVPYLKTPLRLRPDAGDSLIMRIKGGMESLADENERCVVELVFTDRSAWDLPTEGRVPLIPREATINVLFDAAIENILNATFEVKNL